MRLHLLDLVLEPGDAIADQTAVGLDLGLARSAHEAEAAALALQMGPGPHQPAALIVQMRQLDLQRALPRLGAAAENFQDQSGAVEHFCVPGLLEIALLDRRQRAIHHDQLDVVAGDQSDDLLDLALADIVRGLIWLIGAISASATVRSMARARPAASSSRASKSRTASFVCASASPRRTRKIGAEAQSPARFLFPSPTADGRRPLHKFRGSNQITLKPEHPHRLRTTRSERRA